MATLSDVATRAGVSVSAVSRVLSDAAGTRVSDETRKRIVEAARELNYRPNYAARALKFQRTNVVACIVPDLTNAIFAELLRGIEQRARELEYMVLLSRAEGMPQLDASLSQLLGEGRVDGAIVQVTDNVPPDSLRGIVENSLPVVFVHAIHPKHEGSVILDDAAGVRRATQHLIDLGHTRIGFLGGVPESSSAGRREAGFVRTMTDNGLEVVPAWVTHAGYLPQHGREALRTIAARDDRPSALVVANVNAAMAALQEARHVGWKVPDDLSVIAIHDSWPAQNTWPPLTTVRMPLYELGAAAVDAIADRITQRTSGDRVVSTPEPVLVVRESTAPPH